MTSNKAMFQVMDNQKTLEYTLKYHSSVARFGDGEFSLISGLGIAYQDYDPKLAEQLQAILALQSSPEFVICIPDVFERLERYNQFSRDFWQDHLVHKVDAYKAYCTAEWYGSAFISRPYTDLENKKLASKIFSLVKKLWQDKDVLIVEGLTSRSGLGNDLFDNANSVERIICPSRNAYEKIAGIEDAIRQHGAGKLVLLMLGPTAKVIAADLYHEGFHLIDLGHIDSEYEWFKMGAVDKVKLKNKHTAEFNNDQDELFIDDENYLSQIIVDLSDEAKMIKKVSVIVPIQNNAKTLNDTLESIAQQTYKNLEIILLNNASSDDSGVICEEWAKKDARIRVFHEQSATTGKLRNVGLSCATGDYFTFLDPTNWFEKDAIQKLINLLEQQPDSDIAVANYTIFQENTGFYMFYADPDDPIEKSYITSEWVTTKNETRYNLGNIYKNISGKLFRTKSLNDIRFPEESDKQSDFFVYRFYLAATKIVFLNLGLVVIRSNEKEQERLNLAYQEEYMALLASMGFNIKAEKESYKHLLLDKRDHALKQGNISNYHEIVQKIKLLDKV